MSDLAGLTGPPVIRWFEPTPSGPVEQTLVLPLPDFNKAMQAEEENRDLVTERQSSRRVVRKNRRPVFRFGYEYLDADTAETLIAALSTRVVYLKPRTYVAGTDDPSEEANVKEYRCRVTSDIPHTQHQTLEYRIDIELVSIQPGDTGAFARKGSAGFATPGGPGAGTDRAPGPTPTATEEGDPSEDGCYHYRDGNVHNLPAGITSYNIAFDPPLPQTPVLVGDNQNCWIDAWVVDSTTKGITEVFVPSSLVKQFGFTIAFNTGGGGTTGTVDVAYRLRMLKTDAECQKPCWRRNTWHREDSDCAPFTDLTEATWTTPGLVATRAFLHSDKIYIFEADGGWIYTPPDGAGGGNTHVPVPDWPQYAGAGDWNGGGSAGRIGNSIYFYGPNDNQDATPDATKGVLQYFDMSSETWTRVGEVSDFNFSVFDYAGGTGSVFVLWGVGTTTWEYNGASWSSKGNSPADIDCGGAVILFNGDLLQVGGYDNGATAATNEMHYYDGSGWDLYDTLETAVFLPALCEGTGEFGEKYLHVVGGQTDLASSTSKGTQEIYGLTFYPDIGRPFPGVVSGTFKNITRCVGIELDGVLYFGSHSEWATTDHAVGTLFGHAPIYRETINPFDGTSTDYEEA